MDHLERILMALRENRDAANQSVAEVYQTPGLTQETRVARLTSSWVCAMRRHYALLEQDLALRAAEDGAPLLREQLRAPARPPEVPESAIHRRSPAGQRAR